MPRYGLAAELPSVCRTTVRLVEGYQREVDRVSALLSTHSHQRRDTAVTVADEAAGRTGHIRQPSCPIRCKGPTLRCTKGRGQGHHSRVSLWPSRFSGLHSASACILLNRSGMQGQPPSLLSNSLPSAFASSLFSLLPSFPLSPLFPSGWGGCPKEYTEPLKLSLGESRRSVQFDQTTKEKPGYAPQPFTAWF